ncbi:hypothetical protein [Parasphingopyxis sp.]|uniref:hypothetical protein n=1 Tax=Parasphingopyxis sp. TaxID=1920299 RepID=UPI00261ECEF5|nr:hypothetical protein [Parasphingopyxis sp.]
MILAYAASCLLFALAFHNLRIIDKTRELLASLNASFRVISDRTMSDLEKEVAIRRGALRSGGDAVKLAFFFLVTAAAGALPVAAGLYANLYTFEAFLWFSLEPLVLIGTCVIFGGYAWAIARLRTS